MLKILQLKSDVRLEKATIWEMATAFVLANPAENRVFELREFHDKAVHAYAS